MAWLACLPGVVAVAGLALAASRSGFLVRQPLQTIRGPPGRPSWASASQRTAEPAALTSPSSTSARPGPGAWASASQVTAEPAALTSPSSTTWASTSQVTAEPAALTSPSSTTWASASQGTAEPAALTSPSSTSARPAPGAVAFTVLLTHVAEEALLLLRSIARFEPEITVYVSCPSTLPATLQAQGAPRLHYRFRPHLDGYLDSQGAVPGRTKMTKAGTWTRFQMEKARILRDALADGFSGAWYMDGDMFLLAPLPQIHADAALAPHRSSKAITNRFGYFNGGCLFVRSMKALDVWEQAAPTAREACCQDQTALEAIPKAIPATEELPCGVDVGWYSMAPGFSMYGSGAFFKDILCNNKTRRVEFKGCPIQSMHFHQKSKTQGLAIWPFLRKALTECDPATLAALWP